MKKHKIKKIKAREILNSRADWTVEVELKVKNKTFLAKVPSGASTGKREAKFIEPKKAVKNINEIIAPKLTGRELKSQEEIDSFLINLDGTKNKSKIGANAICGVSMVFCRANAGVKEMPLYSYISQIFNKSKSAQAKLPLIGFNIINGGAHAGNNLDFQEFMIVFRGKGIKSSLIGATKVYQELKKIIEKKYGSSAINVGDEGGFAPPIASPGEAINLILKAVESSGYRKSAKIILDVAASEFYFNNFYKIAGEKVSREELLNYYIKLIQKYPIEAIEDPFDEDDWQGFKEITKKIGNKVVIIGDDFLVTNPQIIKKAELEKACNGLLLKVNQIGTVSESLEAARLAKNYGWKIMVSHRSGETCDDFISDLAVGIAADYIKTGAPARSERTAKHNRLLKIEEELK